jgi:hypothetical protein
LSSARNIKGEGHLDDGFAFIHSVTMSQIDDIGCRTNRCAVSAMPRAMLGHLTAWAGLFNGPAVEAAKAEK